MSMFASMTVTTFTIYGLTKQAAVVLCGAVCVLCGWFWMVVLNHCFATRLQYFSNKLCSTLDQMMSCKDVVIDEIEGIPNETLLSRIQHHLARLYQSMIENHHRVEAERAALQALVSDISHQVKLPLSNLDMIADTLMTRRLSVDEQADFLGDLRGQIKKLEFLFQALIKSSRLETGMIHLDRKPYRIYDTIALAISGVFRLAEEKHIYIEVACSESLVVFHDSKWTAEALFNILENAIKYTPTGGRVTVKVHTWDLFTNILIADTGKGIAEERQAQVFCRFYREPEVSAETGVGIGLYLAREIIQRQGGIIKLSSEVGKGSCFTVMLPMTS